MGIPLFKYLHGDQMHIFWCLPNNRRILSRLNLLWGVNSFYYDRYASTDETVGDVNQIAIEKGFVSKGDFLINLAAMPIVDKGMVNTLRVSQV